MKNNLFIHLLVFFLSAHLMRSQDQFTNSGNFKIHTGGNISFYGDFINNGALVDSGNVITLNGSNSQKIGGSSITSFKNLTLANSAGSYLASSQCITGALTISAGTFSTTGHNFTLVSNAQGTARIAPILGDFSGNITMQRYLGPGATSWRFLASPVKGVTLNDWQDNFITSGFPGSSYPNFNFVSIYTYDEKVSGIADNGYNGASSANDPITPGVGYWCYIGPVPLTVDVTGPPVKFNHTFSVTNTSSAGPADDGYVMIGNPYPSSIDWTSPSWTKTKINNAVYIWNPEKQQYASWVAGVSTNGGSNFIASSQSFWIQTNGASPALSCNENIKTNDNAAFLKPSNSLFSASNTLKLTISGNNYSDETVLQFGNGATNGYDNEADARKLFSTNSAVPGISTLDSTLKDMSVNSLPPIHAQIHIPVKTLVGTSGTYTLSNDSSSLIPADYCIVLEDLVTGIKTNLNSIFSYTFFIADTTKAARFLLHMSAPHTATAVPAKCNGDMNGQAIATANGSGPWNYTWFNSTNPSLQNSNNTFSSDTLTNIPAGIYSVQITDVNGLCGSYIKTITVSEPAPIISAFVLSNDTVTAGASHSITIQNTANGAVAFFWNFGDGSPVVYGNSPGAHSYSTAGNYVITQLASNGACSKTSQQSLVVIEEATVTTNPVGLVENGTQNELSIYPNPSNGYFYLQLNNSDMKGLSLDIYSTTGQLLQHSAVTSDKIEINLMDKAKGVYFYNLHGDNFFRQGKLVKE